MNSSDNGKQVIARVATVLLALENKQVGASLTDVMNETNLPRTTVHRILTSLKTQGLVVSDASGFRLGPTIARLAKSVHKDIVVYARPFLEILGRKTHVTVDLCVYRGQHSLLIDQYASDQELRVISPIGTAFPIHCVAHGKAMLAEMTDEQVVSVLEHNLERRTAATITNIDLFIKKLDDIRAKGYALDLEEHADGVCGIGVYVETGLNEKYGVALAIPQVQFHKNFELYYDNIMKCKKEIEEVMLGER